MQFKLSDLNRSIVKVQLLQDVSSAHYDYKITNAADVDKLVGPELRKLDREYLLAIYLNSRNKVIDIQVLAIGLSPNWGHPQRNAGSPQGSIQICHFS